METILDYCKEYWWLILLAVPAFVLLGFALKKAKSAYSKYYSTYRAEETKMKRLIALKEQYKDLSVDVIKEADEKDLLEGVALCYQLKLQKLDNMEAEFATYNIEKQYIYALDVFCQSESVSKFFRENGREITEIIVPAIEYIGLDEIATEVEKLRIMFDEKDETTSINQNVIDMVDNYVKENNSLNEIKLSSALKIKSEAEKFIF